MSALCQTSSNLLSLSDTDLTYLSTSTSKKPLTRCISIILFFTTNLTIATTKDQHFGRIKVPRWSVTENTPSQLCASCSFYLLLHQGIQRSINTNRWPRMENKEKQKQGTLSTSNSKSISNKTEDEYEKSIPVELQITLTKLAYLKDTSPWASGQLSLKRWNVHAVLLSGSLTLSLHHAPMASAETSDLQDKLELEHESREIEIEFEMFANQEDKLAKLLNVHRCPLDTDPLSERNVENIKRWMGECEGHHEWCCTAPSLSQEHEAREPFVPTRLLDIGTDRLTEPRLILSTSHFSTESLKGDDCRYMALSYCWGTPDESSRLLKTTHSTIQDRLRGIPIKIMPRAFQDAITVARSLDLRYVWIDSLCIIQDDARDWQRESGRMAAIFESAYLTVVAAVGSSCHSSFLYRDPNPLSCAVEVRSTKLWPGVGDDGMGVFSLRPRRRRGTEKMSEIVNSRWITRGWTFQEERLARRVLMFGTSKFFLDCRTMERAEDTSYYRLRPDWVGSVCGIPDGENGAVRASKYAQARSGSDHWQTLVSHNSFRELSFEGDKLPAVSGIASKFSDKFGGGYLAGLWREHLPHDLFWYAPMLCERPRAYRAPSWSWASVDRKIMYPFWKECGASECEMFCSIVDARVSVMGLDPFGAVSDGFLKIEGHVMEMDVSQIPERKASLPQWSLKLQDMEIAHAMPDSAKLGPGESRRYWALLFAKCKLDESSNAQKPQARGLLLEKCEQKRDGLDLFQRVGVFYVLQTSEDIEPAVDPWKRSTTLNTIIIV